MTVELGHLFDQAVRHIAAARTVAADSTYAPALLQGAVAILSELDSATRDFGWSGDDTEHTVMAAATNDLRTHFLAAAHRMTTAHSLATGPPRLTPLDDTRTLVAAARDLLNTHRGPDGEPLTHYALLLAQAGHQHYLALRMTDVTWHLGRLTADLADAAVSSVLRDELTAARAHLDQATVLGRHTHAPAARHAIASLPPAPPPGPLPSSEPGATTLKQLSTGSEYLLRTAFESAHGRPVPPHLSGTDLTRLARSLSLMRLLSAQLVRHTHADPTSRNAASAEAVTALLEAARHWHSAAASWHHIVDLNDPTDHPQLPPYDLATVRRHQAVPMPRPDSPHPACALAQTLAVRTGRLLYGPAWQPTHGTRGHPTRPPAVIWEETGGPGPLWEALYQAATAGRHLAAAIPVLIERRTGHLVTDSIDHRSQAIPPHVRFYPAHHRQIAHLVNEHSTCRQNDDALRSALARLADTADHPISRVDLDNAVVRLFPAPAASLSPRQVAQLQRISEASEQRRTHFTEAVQRLRPAARPNPVQPHSPEPRVGGPTP
ncbi:hypothetical protein [Streptomyces sp. NPDC059991]|uniref:hypothetical protein n=1 Tax=unclassified Streptomyces TaxID=2593676 RepID=UPI003695F066